MLSIKEVINIYTWNDGTELYHHGILGQKWGVRRYQNPDGTLTAAGRRRRNQNESGKMEKPDSTESSKPKSLNDMSDEELRNYKSRLQLQKDILDLQKQIKPETKVESIKKSPEESKGKKFIEDTAKSILNGPVKNAANAYIEKKLRDKLGLNTKSEHDKLKNEFETLTYKKKIEELKNEDSSKQEKQNKQQKIYEAYNEEYTNPKSYNFGGDNSYYRQAYKNASVDFVDLGGQVIPLLLGDNSSKKKYSDAIDADFVDLGKEIVLMLEDGKKKSR